MTDAIEPKTRKPRKSAATKQTHEFKPLTVPEGAKAILTPDNQLRFYALFMGLAPAERAAVVMVLNSIASSPLLDDGYRKFFRFWRAFGPSINSGNVIL